MDEVQEIKNKLDIVSIVQGYFPLNRAGTNWKANCPFHTEKSPSFMVNQDRQFYYCFGCNEGGDIFSFVQKIEGLEFAETLKLLADKAGVTLSKTNKRASNQKTRLVDLMEMATKYWQAVLKSEYGTEARKYLAGRGLEQEIIETFKLGYALDNWQHLTTFLKQKGFTEAEVVQSGLAIRKESGSRPYDRFRDRVIFPITNAHGSVIGVTARAMKKSEAAKYINTPETLLYHKGEVLYGLNEAKKAARSQDYLILVEGNMDVIASYKVGVQNVVAISGIALTTEQIGLIKRFTNNIAVCFDMDEAGQTAAKRSIDMALQAEMNIKVVQLKFGKDPDECIAKDPNLWREAIKNATSVMQYYFDRTLSKYDVSQVDGKKKVAKELLKEINKLINPIEKDHWLKILAQRLGVSERVLSESLSKSTSTDQQVARPVPAVSTTQKPAAVKVQKPKNVQTQELVLSMILNLPTSMKYASENLSPEALSPTLRELYKKMVVCYTETEQLNKQNLSEYLFGQEILHIDENNLNSLYLYRDKEFSDQTDEEAIQEINHLIKAINKQYYHDSIVVIEQQMTQAKGSENPDDLTNLAVKLQDLLYKKSKLE